MDSIEDLTYEQAYIELESTTQRLEAGELSLEESLALYERGQALASHCDRLLTEAKLRIDRVTPGGDVPLAVPSQ